MTSITGNTFLDTLTAKTTSTTAATTANGSLDQSAFLKLMTTQLQTQDPTAPTDNNQMVAQMAQFSQVAGIAEMNSSLRSIVTDIQSSRMGDAASWIGRSALVTSSTTAPLADGSYEGQITLADDASAVTLSLVDANGTIVHRQDLGANAAGTVAYGWDGKSAGGSAVPGPLTVNVSATGSAGSVEAAAAAWTTVSGVQSPAGGATAKLVTSLGLIAPTDALSLS